MITYARKEWEPYLKRIWKECFHDEDSYINFYFENRFVPEEMVVWVENQVPVAMASLLPAFLWKAKEGNPVKQKLYYIYAVATLPEYSGRGISSRLMEFVLQKMEMEHAVGLLVPADNGLVSFYKKRGFYPAFKKKGGKYEMNPEALITLNEVKISNPLSIHDEMISAERYKQIRDQHFGGNGYVEWDLKGIAYAQEENRFIGGICKELTLDGVSHILMGVKDKNEFIVRETTLTMEQLKNCKDLLLTHFSCEQLVVREMMCMSNVKVLGKEGYFDLALD